jgi:cytochrome c-type biogenesis protein CcmH/NrfF
MSRRRIHPVRPLAALFLGVLILLGAGDDAGRVKRLGHQMICMCGCSYLLLECNHMHCAYLSQMREELTAAVGRGDGDDTILQSFVQKYGTVVLAAPTGTGFNRIAWIMPYLALVLGITVIASIVGTWKKRRSPAAATAAGGALHTNEVDRFRDQARKETEL